MKPSGANDPATQTLIPDVQMHLAPLFFERLFACQPASETMYSCRWSPAMRCLIFALFVHSAHPWASCCGMETAGRGATDANSNLFVRMHYRMWPLQHSRASRMPVDTSEFFGHPSRPRNVVKADAAPLPTMARLLPSQLMSLR